MRWHCSHAIGVDNGKDEWPAFTEQLQKTMFPGTRKSSQALEEAGPLVTAKKKKTEFAFIRRKEL